MNRQLDKKFYNTSKYDFETLKADTSSNFAANLRNYMNGFSSNAREIIDHFNFEAQIDKLDQGNLLYMVVSKFNEIDLHPDVVDNTEMGYIFES